MSKGNPASVRLPYGKKEVEVELPKDAEVRVLYPNDVSVQDENKTLKEAISRPLESKRLNQFLQGEDRYLVIVNDATRPTPTSRVLKQIYPALESRDVEFIVATGSHREPLPEEYDFIFGEYRQEWKDRIHCHDSKNDENFYVGETSRGTEVRLNILAKEAKKFLPIGSVEPHYFAGYTGGRKSFIPGISAYKTIEQNHSHAIEPGARALALEGNPVHEDIMEGLNLWKRGEIFSIMTVLDRYHRVYFASAGDLEASFLASVSKANEVYSVPIEQKADIVVTVARFPMDVDLYQAQKALDNAKYAARKDAIIILVSQCRDGIGLRSFYDLISESDSPESVLERVRLNYRLGWHKAAKIAEMLCHFKLWAVTDLPDKDLNAIFLEPKHTIQGAVDDAISIKGSNSRICFLMDGSLTVPHLT